jgi:hypothetical protein
MHRPRSLHPVLLVLVLAIATGTVLALASINPLVFAFALLIGTYLYRARDGYLARRDRSGRDVLHH